MEILCKEGNAKYLIFLNANLYFYSVDVFFHFGCIKGGVSFGLLLLIYSTVFYGKCINISRLIIDFQTHNLVTNQIKSPSESKGTR